MIRLLFAPFTSYNRICSDEHVATHPDDEIEVATSGAIRNPSRFGRCSRLLDCDFDEAEYTWK